MPTDGMDFAEHVPLDGDFPEEVTPRRKPEGPAPRMLRVDAAAQYLSVSKGALRTLIYSGQIPAVRLGEGTSPYLIDVHDLDQLIDRRKERLHL